MKDSVRKYTVDFGGTRCQVDFLSYGNGRPALRLSDEMGSVTVPTVNLPETDLPPNYVVVKDYNENKGMLAALVNGGIVEDTGIRVPLGFVEGRLCRLLVAPQPSQQADRTDTCRP